MLTLTVGRTSPRGENRRRTLAEALRLRSERVWGAGEVLENGSEVLRVDKMSGARLSNTVDDVPGTPF